MTDHADFASVSRPARAGGPTRAQEPGSRHDALEARPQSRAERDYGEMLNGRPMVAAQRKAAERLAGRPSPGPRPVQRAAAPNRTGLPDRLKAGAESLSGHSLDDVRVHYNSSKPAQLNALAYAQGTDIHLAPGQEKHLPHEAWHVVQQAQGRVSATRQLTEGVKVNDDIGLEREADLMGARAPRAADGPATGPCLSVGGRSTFSAPIQMKKVIKGTHRVGGRGNLDVDFEERSQGKSTGVYGIIGFMPDKADTSVTEKIDLIQIASLRANDQGNQEIATSGVPQVKDMWRVNGKLHMDLLGDQSKPRTSMKDPQIEEGYNSERRKWKPEDRLDEAVMGNDDKIVNQYEVINAQQQKKKLEGTTTRQIAQAPGFNKGDGNVRGTELFDYPKCSLPAIASFHTTVDGDGKPWATVTWGFTSKKMDYDDDMELLSVQGPTFVDGQTEEMKAARKSFNDIMANAASWTSPEAFDEVLGLLKSKKDEEYEDGKKKLSWMAASLESTILKIQEASAPYLKEKNSEKEAKQILKDFLKPHVDMLKNVLDELYRTKQDQTRLYSDMVDLFNKAMVLMK
jgi:hypothetical protein